MRSCGAPSFPGSVSGEGRAARVWELTLSVVLIVAQRSCVLSAIQALESFSPCLLGFGSGRRRGGGVEAEEVPCILEGGVWKLGLRCLSAVIGRDRGDRHSSQTDSQRRVRTRSFHVASVGGGWAGVLCCIA